MTNIKNRRLDRVWLYVMAVFALMAFAASAAQAAPPEWMVGGANISTNTVVPVKLSPELIEFQNGAGKDDVKAGLLLSNTALGAPSWISCKKAESTAAGITLEAGGKAKGEVEFTECSTSLLNASKQMTLSAVCAPKQPIKAGFVASLVLVGGVEYAKVEGVGGTFTTLEFPNEECSLSGQKSQEGGWILIRDCEGKFSTEQLSHLIEEDMAATLAAGGGLTLNGRPASLDGSFIMEVFQSGVMKTFSWLA